MFLETAQCRILVAEVDFYRGKGHNFALFMMIGYLVGIAFLRLNRCRKLSDNVLLSAGYYISFFSLIPYFLLYGFLGNNGYLLGISYFAHALGNALLSPTIITVLVKGRNHHDQGKLLGLIESTDTISLLFSTGLVMVLAYFNIPIFYLIAFSFLCFTASWIFYSKLIADSKSLRNAKESKGGKSEMGTNRDE